MILPTRLRALLVLVFAGAWLWPLAPPAWDAWAASVPTPSTLGASPDALRAPLPEGRLAALLVAAQSACPAGKRVLVLSDEPAAWFLGSYLLYPRRLDVVQSVDGFTAADMESHRGGCAVIYGPHRHRIEPYLGDVATVTCGQDGCVFRVQD